VEPRSINTANNHHDVAQASATLMSDKSHMGTVIDTHMQDASEENGSPKSRIELSPGLLTSLEKRASYSSIESYLTSMEEAVPYESIEAASRNFNNPKESLSDAELPPCTPAMKRASEAFPAARLGGDYSPYSRSRPDSVDSDDNGSVDTAGTAGTGRSSLSAYSCASGSSRYRSKKHRRQANWEPDPEPFACSYCDKTFTFKKAMATHERNAHRTFPCTFCDTAFATTEKWEEHEADLHCQPRRTWFCMLGLDFRLRNCLICDSSPSQSHYGNSHLLFPCRLPRLARTFSTRFEILQHLTQVHGICQREIAVIEGKIDAWSLMMNVGCTLGLWCCGYCPFVGADWDSRVRHIKTHWADDIPAIERKYRWSNNRTIFQTPINQEYYDHLSQGNDRPVRRPSDFYFMTMSCTKPP
jgi:hypothetical protein